MKNKKYIIHLEGFGKLNEKNIEKNGIFLGIKDNSILLDLFKKIENKEIFSQTLEFNFCGGNDSSIISCYWE